MHDHPGDHLQTPTDAPYFGQTSWHSFNVPERALTGQLYAFFLPNLGVCAAAVYVWDASGDSLSTCRYAKNFWHLPMPSGDLPDLALANGIRYQRLEPGMRYALSYRDPDNDPAHAEISIDLEFEGFDEPNMLSAAHLDQPGRFSGELVLDGETIAVDGPGMRDSSWSARSPFGGGMQSEGPGGHGGYTWGVATARHADSFHAISREDASRSMPVLAGFLQRDGKRAPLAGGERVVVDRVDDRPAHIRLHLQDQLGRTADIQGRCVNALGMHRTPNAWTWNCLTHWEWDGQPAIGEDHDNWSTAGVRRFRRGEL